MPRFLLNWSCTFTPIHQASSFSLSSSLSLSFVLPQATVGFNVHRWIHRSYLAFRADRYSLPHYSRNERLALQCDLISPQGFIRQDRVVLLNEPQSVWACVFAPAVASCDPFCKTWSAMLIYSSLKYAHQFNSEWNQTEEHRKEGCQYVLSQILVNVISVSIFMRL